MRRIKEVIVVEGRYDKNALLQVVDATVLETAGFGVFNDRQKQKLLRSLAEKRGLIVLTDPDGAGFVIRNFLRSCLEPRLVKHAYVPDIAGKERRKTHASKEGKLGVEGMRPAVLLAALERAGATFEDGEDAPPPAPGVTKADLYALGMSGQPGSREKRAALIAALDLPERITADALLEVVNAYMTREEFFSLCNALPQNET